MEGDIMMLESNRGKIPAPCMDVVLIPAAKLRANNYNPEQCSKNNMDLLEQSIIDNGFLLPDSHDL